MCGVRVVGDEVCNACNKRNFEQGRLDELCTDMHNLFTVTLRRIFEKRGKNASLASCVAVALHLCTQKSFQERCYVVYSYYEKLQLSYVLFDKSKNNVA